MMASDTKTLFVLIVAILSTLLGLFIFTKNQHSSLNKSYGIMTLLVGFWSFAAFGFRIAPPDNSAFFLGIMLYDAAALLPTSFLVVTLIFPPYNLLTKKLGFVLALELITVIILTNIPGLIIKNLVETNGDNVLQWGSLYIIYMLHHIALFSWGYLVLIEKYYSAVGLEKRQLKIIILGTIIPANLAMVSNLILPWFGEYGYYTWAGQACMILLIFFSGYAILKHKLFDIKVITTEIFTVATLIILLIRALLAQNSIDRLVGWVVFSTVLIFGVLLIRSVWKEVQQRQTLENLTTQLTEANTQLQALDKARAEFLSIASHQLRTPPATLKWYLASILEGDYGPVTGELKAALNKAYFTNNGLISLVEDLLNVSRIERGTMEFLFEQTDVTEITKAALDQLLPIANEKKLKLILKKPRKRLPLITADKEKLRQVINNLIDNAIKYTQKGRITVELAIDSDNFIIKVSDTGKGISLEDHNIIFEKYKRGKDSHHQSMGLGLGLYLARIVIEQHKGKIWAESDGEGHGSTFTITLPLQSSLETSSLLDLTHT